MGTMPRILFVTHPEVVIDPGKPVSEWPLSPLGRERMQRFAEYLRGGKIEVIYSSDEQKALDGASILADALGIPAKINDELGENDRSSTGYIAPPKFWEVVTEFFAHPDESVLGWETARHAQARIVVAMSRIAESHRDAHSIAVVSHGGVGRLLMAHLQGRAIGDEDIPDHPGGGCLFVTTDAPPILQSGWTTIENYQSSS